MSENEPISGSSRDYGSTAAPPTVGFSDNSPAELNNLCESVADNVGAINSGLRTVAKFMKQLGGPNDNVQLRERIHNTQQSVNGYISATEQDTKRLIMMARIGDKAQKLLVERLTNAYKDSLANYSSIQKQVSEKMAAYMPQQKRVRNDPNLMEQQAIADDEEATLLANQQVQARQAMIETNMLLEKEAYISKIETDVLDVNQIMQNLATLAQSQGQVVDTVSSHIEEACAGVEAGVDELAKAEAHQRSYRRKKLFLYIIIMIVAILIIVYIVKALR